MRCAGCRTRGSSSQSWSRSRRRSIASTRAASCTADYGRVSCCASRARTWRGSRIRRPCRSSAIRAIRTRRFVTPPLRYAHRHLLRKYIVSGCIYQLSKCAWPAVINLESSPWVTVHGSATKTPRTAMRVWLQPHSRLRQASMT